MPANQSTPEVTRALKPCPFCGKDDAFVEQSTFASSYVICNDCMARGPDATQQSDDEDEPGREAAITAWETRAALPLGLDHSTQDDLIKRIYANQRTQWVLISKLPAGSLELEAARTAADVLGEAARALSATPARGGDELREALEPLVRELDEYAKDWRHNAMSRVGFAIFRDRLAILASADMAGAGEMTQEERRLEDLKQMAAYSGPIVSFDVREPYYLASCDHCGWVGSSEHCGTDSFGDDSDVYCPRCQTGGADCGKVAERIASAPPVEGLTSGEGCVPCERCQGNGEIVTDWDRYEHARPGDVGDEAVSDCPDCDGTGRAASPKATATASVREAIDDEALDRYLPESIHAEKRCGIQRSDWLTGWFVSWSPRNDNQNAEGPWSHWVALANAILAADAKAIATLQDSGTAATIGGERA